MSKSLRADLMLVMVTLCWAFSYWLTKICFVELEPMTLNAFRFLGGFIIAFLFSINKFKNISKETIKHSFILGGVLGVVYILATVGIMYTSISNAGFLSGLAVVFTPIVAFLLFKKRPERKLIVVVMMCLVGVSLLTLTENFSINPATLKGDILCILCSFFFACHIVFAERAVSSANTNPYQLGVFQLGIAGVINFALSFVFEKPTLPSSFNVWIAALFLAVLCTGVAFIVQVVAQQYTSAARVGVIFCLEPVFAGVVAFVLGGEILSSQSYVGVVLIVSALFIMEINFKNMLKRNDINGVKSE